MEEDIKILEKFTKIVKGKDYNAKNGWHGYYDNELIVLGKTIENLIKGYRELYKKHDDLLVDVYDLFIPKSKIKMLITQIESAIDFIKTDNSKIKVDKYEQQEEDLKLEIIHLQKLMEDK